MSSTRGTAELDRPKLSICIATFNRAQFIGATLDSILGQMEHGVEIIIVDGASQDNTREVISQYLSCHPTIRYYREEENAGVDRDYDKAVGYASGEYCWLMPDDDLLVPGAILRILKIIDGTVELLVVNSEIWNADFSRNLRERTLDFHEDKDYRAENPEKVFTELASCLSYIGSVVIKRSIWLSRDRSSYYGTAFIHVGVVFQHPPIERVKVIIDPLIIIRYGNGLWSPRSFEVWNIKWPRLIWSFSDFSENAKRMIVRREPWRHPRALFYSRATGEYSPKEFQKFLSCNSKGISHALAYVVSAFPAKWANFIAVVYFSVAKRSAQRGLFDLLRSRHSTAAGRYFASMLGIKVI